MPPVLRFSRHARLRAQEMGLTVEQLRLCLVEPTYTRRVTDGKYDGATVYTHGEVSACVLEDTVTTVVWSRNPFTDPRFDRETKADSDRGGSHCLQPAQVPPSPTTGQHAGWWVRCFCGEDIRGRTREELLKRWADHSGWKPRGRR